jgi:hypothetical protein
MRFFRFFNSNVDFIHEFNSFVEVPHVIPLKNVDIRELIQSVFRGCGPKTTRIKGDAAVLVPPNHLGLVVHKRDKRPERVFSHVRGAQTRNLAGIRIPAGGEVLRYLAIIREC